MTITKQIDGFIDCHVFGKVYYNTIIQNQIFSYDLKFYLKNKELGVLQIPNTFLNQDVYENIKEKCLQEYYIYEEDLQR